MQCTRFLALLACGALALAACGGGTGDSPGAPGAPAASNLRILVTDAPFPLGMVESATVTIREVRVREQSRGGWETVFEGSETIDLVPLTGGVSQLLVDVALEPGVYDEVRLIVEAGQVVLHQDAVVQGNSHTFSTENGGLHHPSAGQTGIKVKLDNEITVTTGLTSDLTLDFDLSKNFVVNGSLTKAPGVRRIVFTPVVRAVNSSTAGRVDMTVYTDNATPGDDLDDAPLANVAVRAFDDQDVEVGSGFTGADGYLSLQLPAGSFRLAFEAGAHDPLERAGVSVALANLTPLGDVLMAGSSGSLTGTVMSDGATVDTTDDDLVLEGAAVSVTLQGEVLPAATTTTDNQGAFAFTSLPPGTYDVSVTRTGFGDGLVADVVPTAVGTELSIFLAAHTRRVTGTVTNDLDEPQADATVSVVNAAGVEVASTTTAADGTYAASLATGSYQVTFTSSDEALTQTVDLEVEGTDPETDLVLDGTL